MLSLLFQSKNVPIEEKTMRSFDCMPQRESHLSRVKYLKPVVGLISVENFATKNLLTTPPEQWNFGFSKL
jgi:hypothetical protein